MINHETELKLQAYLDGELPAGEAKAITDLLERDASAQRTYQELRSTRSLLAGNEVERKLPESPEFYWSKIRRQIEQLESQAEQMVLKAFDRWSQKSGVSITSISPQWKHDADEYMTLQCRVDATGNMGTVKDFLYSIEKDPLALKLEVVEISTRDPEGQLLNLGLQISGLVLTPKKL